jgi:hypothetical protein
LENKTISPQKEFQRIVPIAISNACFSIKLSKELIEDCKQKCKGIVENARNYGQHYTDDDGELEERFINGHGAQVALEQHLGIKFTNWNSKKPDNVADLLPIGLMIGIKSFKAPNNAPLIFKDTKYPEIIMAIDENDKSLFHCLGVFSKTKLSYPDFRCDSLIHDPRIKKRNTKTGFYKIDVGVPFTTLDDLKKIAGNNWLIKK